MGVATSPTSLVATVQILEALLRRTLEYPRAKDLRYPPPLQHGLPPDSCFYVPRLGTFPVRPCLPSSCTLLGPQGPLSNLFRLLIPPIPALDHNPPYTEFSFFRFLLMKVAQRFFAEFFLQDRHHSSRCFVFFLFRIPSEDFAIICFFHFVFHRTLLTGLHLTSSAWFLSCSDFLEFDATYPNLPFSVSVREDWLFSFTPPIGSSAPSSR